MPEVLVVGGGPAGSAAATLLARAGRNVVLLERTRTAQHKVCGEFLSGEALEYLAELGVDVAVLGAVPLRQVRLVAREILAEAALPFAAQSLTRQSLDEALLACAAAAGVTVQRGAQVENIAPGNDGWCATVAGGQQFAAPQLFMAVGKHDLRGRPRPPGAQRGLVALKMYFRLAKGEMAALGNAVEVILFRGGYAGLQPVEGGAANLCLLVNKYELRRCGGHWDAMLAHLGTCSEHLRRRLAGAEPLLERPLALSSIPYGFVRERAEPGIWWLGDQAAVIPSFAGDGMSIALHSAHRATQGMLAGRESGKFQAGLESELRRQVRWATAVSRLMVGAPALAQLARLWPGMLQGIARSTRVAERAGIM